MIETGVYEIGPDNADLLLGTQRAGLIGSVGHDLVLRVGTWSAVVEIGDDPAECRLSAEVDLRTLEVVAATGGVKPVSDRDRAEIVRNAGKALDVRRHPLAVFRSLEVRGDWSGGVVHGELDLHGMTGPLDLPVELVDGAYRMRATVSQTRYGITPYSAMLGMLTIRDEVTVEVTVAFE